MTLDEARDAVGRKVVYRTAYGRAEEGVITSVNSSYVFVRYGTGTTSAATAPEALTFISNTQGFPVRAAELLNGPDGKPR